MTIRCFLLAAYEQQTMPVWSVAWPPDQGGNASGSGFFNPTDLDGEIWAWEFSRP